MTNSPEIASAAPFDEHRGSESRGGPRAFDDLLNPILVREVRQAVKGRLFPLTVLLALGASVLIAVANTADWRNGDGDGRSTFEAGLATLLPLLVFVVPMQAYQSMRTELRSGIVEQLLLSRLSPSRILAGKLQAAMVQFVLYVALLSPLLATSYLLRGVDLPTIVVSLLFGLVCCLVATSLAISSAAQAMVPSLQPLAHLGVAMGLGLGTFLLVGLVLSGQYVRGMSAVLAGPRLGIVMSGVGLLALVSTTMSWLSARSHLLHAFENRSTGFRVFLFVLLVLAYGWLFAFVPTPARDRVLPWWNLMLLIVGGLFGVFMVTETRELSPRVRAHVPRGRLAAALSAPFLPGRDRGLLCFAVYLVALAAVAVPLWPVRAIVWMGPDERRIAQLLVAYWLFYLHLGWFLRTRLPETLPGSQGARILLPVVFTVGCVLPLLIDVFVDGRAREWHIGHVLNVFWTVEYFVDGNGAGQWTVARPVVWGVIVAGLLGVVLVGLRAVPEVLRAAVARRAREAAKDGVQRP